MAFLIVFNGLQSTWNFAIPGPEGTPWAGGLYWGFVFFTGPFPAELPTIRFDPPLIHPNFDRSGTLLCHFSTIDKHDDLMIFFSGIVDPRIFKDIAVSDLSITVLLKKVQSVLANPSLSNVVNVEIGNLWCWNKPVYNARAKAQATKYQM